MLGERAARTADAADAAEHFVAGRKSRHALAHYLHDSSDVASDRGWERWAEWGSLGDTDIDRIGRGGSGTKQN
jgi:hypothetical protein